MACDSRLPLVAFAIILLPACTSFGAVRSAEVIPGPSVTARLSVATPPGDDAAWFWSFDCASDCDHPIPAAEVEYAHGFRAGEGGRRMELGGGISGLAYPFVHGYVQLAEGDRPFGVGARLGFPLVGRWHEHQLFGRLDLPLPDGKRLLFSPALFVHTGRSPNGENPGTFLALVPAVGLHRPGRWMSMTPSAALVLGRTRRESYGERIRSGTTFFTASLSATFHRRRR